MSRETRVSFLAEVLTGENLMPVCVLGEMGSETRRDVLLRETIPIFSPSPFDQTDQKSDGDTHCIFDSIRLDSNFDFDFSVSLFFRLFVLLSARLKMRLSSELKLTFCDLAGLLPGWRITQNLKSEGEGKKGEEGDH